MRDRKVLVQEIVTRATSLAGRLVALLLLVLASLSVHADVVLVTSAFTAGAGGTFWITDVQLMNPTSADVTVTPTLFNAISLEHVNGATLTVPPLGQVTYQNVLSSLFGQSAPAAGPIRFVTTGSLLVSASVYSTNACGKVALTLPAYAPDQAMTTALIPQLVSDATSRTNLIFLNATSVAANITLFNLSTQQRTDVTLAAGGYTQLSAFGDGVGAFAVYFTSDQPLLAVATVIDNQSGQAYAVAPVHETISPVQPAISTFTTTPATIAAGQSATLRWSSTGGASASIDNGVGVVPTSGTVSVSPSQTTTYTLAVLAAFGGADAKSVTVSVSGATAAPQITSFTASPSTITSGQSSTLSWSSAGATTSLINGQRVSGPSGTLVVSPSITTTYTLVASSASGADTRSVTVTVSGLPKDCNVTYTVSPQNQTVVYKAGVAALVTYTISTSGSAFCCCSYEVSLPTLDHGAIAPWGGINPLTIAGGMATVAIYQVTEAVPGVYPLTFRIYPQGYNSGVVYGHTDVTVTLTVQ